MTPEECRVLYDYNSWANHRTVEACTGLTVDQFLRDLGSSFRSVRDTLAHIMHGEWIWLERFQGRSPNAMPTADLYGNLDSLRARWGEIEQNLVAFVGGLQQADIDRVFEYKTISYGAGKNPMWQSLQHLVNHGTYHRGQIATMLRQLSAKPISTDMTLFHRQRAAGASA
ncbi:MAG TPA: DinB family protein [Candidatus Acidoferrales bacterium]|nr:DinB family protein [Candidatus Acidoferrales bacterium]